MDNPKKSNKNFEFKVLVRLC